MAIENRDHRTAELPVATPSKNEKVRNSSVERKQTVATTQAELRDVDSEIFDRMNYGFRMPKMDDIVSIQKTVPGQLVNFEEVQKMFQEGHYEKALIGIFKLIFGGKNAVDGIGYISKVQENIPDRLKVGALSQLENQHPTDLDKKVGNSAITAGLELSLLDNGYKRSAPVRPTRKQKIETGKTHLASYIPAAIMKKLEGEKPEVLSALTLQTDLPVGAYLYLDQEGYPLYILNSDLDLTADPQEIPKISLFKQQQNPKKFESKQAACLEYLKNKLQPGDILLVSAGSNNTVPGMELMEIGVRSASRGVGQGESFHGIHAMVYDGSKVLHLTLDGAKKETLEDVFGEDSHLSAVTIARVPEQLAGHFNANVGQVFEQMKDYNLKKMANLGLSFIQTGKMVDQTSTQNSGICTDYVTKAAGMPPGNPILAKLSQAITAADIAASTEVSLVGSFVLK